MAHPGRSAPVIEPLHRVHRRADEGRFRKEPAKWGGTTSRTPLVPNRGSAVFLCPAPEPLPRFRGVAGPSAREPHMIRTSSRLPQPDSFLIQRVAIAPPGVAKL